MISIFKEPWAPPTIQDAVELTRLYRSIEEGLERRPGSSIAITCPHQSEQVLRLTYDLAWIGSTLLGKRVLVLDTTTPDQSPVVRTWDPVPRTPPPAGAKAEAVATAPKHALIEMDRALQEPRTVGLLSLRVSPAKEMAITPQLTEIWGRLQTTFDMIIVAAPPVLDDPTASCLGTVVDGAILLVSSGLSRQRDVTRAIELLTSGATPLLGVVMTDRQHTFPRWIRWMFGKD